MKKTISMILALALALAMALSLTACGAPKSYTLTGEFVSPGESGTVLPFTLTLAEDKSVTLDAGDFGAWTGKWDKDGDNLKIDFDDYETDIGYDAEYVLLLDEEYGLTYTSTGSDGSRAFTLNLAIDLTWYMYPFELELKETK